MLKVYPTEDAPPPISPEFDSTVSDGRAPVHNI